MNSTMLDTKMNLSFKPVLHKHCEVLVYAVMMSVCVSSTPLLALIAKFGGSLLSYQTL